MANRHTARLRLRDGDVPNTTVARGPSAHSTAPLPPSRIPTRVAEFGIPSAIAHGYVTGVSALPWRPKTSAAFRQLPRRCGSGPEDSRAAERQRPSARGPRARERRLQARLAQPPTPNGPTAAACARRAFRGTRVVARRNAFSGSSSITPSGPVRPFRLARVPRPGMTNTDVRLGSSMTDTERTSHPRMCHDVSPQALTRPRDRGNLTLGFAETVVIDGGPRQERQREAGTVRVRAPVDGGVSRPGGRGVRVGGVTARAE